MREILHNLKSDPDGITHFGDDGVLRSYSSSGTVIDHARLTNEHLMLAARWLPSDKQNLMKKKWAGVDGFQAPSEQIESPPSHLRPLLLEKPEAYNDLRQMARQVSRPRELQERSDHCSSVLCETDRACVLANCHRCVVYDNLLFTQCI